MEDNNINLTIIIPHYNITNMLCRLISTIPDREDIEVIIVDDHSTESLDIVIQQIEKRLNTRIIVNEVNKGAGASRNIAIKEAKGKWVLFADADDMFTEDMYNVVSYCFDSDSDLIYFNMTSVDEESGKLATRHILYDRLIKKYLADRKNKYNMMQLKYKTNGPVAKLVRLEMIRNNDIYFEETTVSNDEMFSSKISVNAKKFDVIDECIYIVTSRQNSLITSISKKSFWIRLGVFIRKYKYLKSELPQKDFKMIDLSAQEKIFSAIQNKYDVKYIFEVIKILIKNGIPLLTIRTFYPSVFVEKIRVARNLKMIKKSRERYLQK